MGKEGRRKSIKRDREEDLMATGTCALCGEGAQTRREALERGRGRERRKAQQGQLAVTGSWGRGRLKKT